MKCDVMNGYGGWAVVDVTGARIESVAWVDPDARQFCTYDIPLRVVAGEVAVTIHQAEHIAVDILAATFFVRRGPMRRELHGDESVHAVSTVAALMGSRQQPGELADDRPCDACCQPQACRRACYCAAYRCGFGEADKP